MDDGSDSDPSEGNIDVKEIAKIAPGEIQSEILKNESLKKSQNESSFAKTFLETSIILEDIKKIEMQNQINPKSNKHINTLAQTALIINQ